MKTSIWALLLVSLVAGSGISAAGEFDLEAGLQGTWFPEEPLDPQQHGSTLSLHLEPEYYHDWSRGDQRLAVKLFGRLDSGDDSRTHADIRELYWRGTFGRSFDLYVGFRRVFWGVVESVHLVDIVNQTDLVENLDTEEKLGQPMVSATWVLNWGTWDAFVMPVFRERTFPGPEGRLRPPLVVDTENPVYESAAGQTHLDVAIRWSHYVGDFDLGAAHFSGTSREALLVPGLSSSGEPVLFPHYDQLQQTSLDGQYTIGAWLWKLEAVSRDIRSGRSTALAGGFEYTWVGIFGSSKDLGLLSEYQYDDRPDLVASDNDFVVGARLTFNNVDDTNLLGFAAVDTEDGSIFASIEGSRRVGTAWKLELESRLFLNAQEGNLVHFLRNDSYVRLDVIRYF